MNLKNRTLSIEIEFYKEIWNMHLYNLMETQTRLSHHNKFISAENTIAILSVLSDDSLLLQSSKCGVSVCIQKIK